MYFRFWNRALDSPSSKVYCNNLKHAKWQRVKPSLVTESISVSTVLTLSPYAPRYIPGPNRRGFVGVFGTHAVD